MDINKEVDRLAKAVRENDGDAAIKYDSRLAVFEKQIADGLMSMPKEHAETMSFYFRDWIMHLFDVVMYIGLIILGFHTSNDFLSAVLIGIGAVALLVTFLARLSYDKFCAGDISRMRKEKIMANDYKMQLNYVRKSRAEYAQYIDQIIEERLKNNPIESFFSNSLSKKLDELENEISKNSQNKPAE